MALVTYFWALWGILVGAKLDVFDIIAFDSGLFFASLVVCHRELNCLWEIIVVYGPADHSYTQLFLDELSSKLSLVNLPTVLGGDFNLLRHPSEKNNSNFSWSRAEVFNEFISNFALHEIPRSGARFTWSNHQLCPVRCVLDRVFICARWDDLYPWASLIAESHIGSDHTPLVLDSGHHSPRTASRFHFDAAWLEVPGFFDTLSFKISSSLSSVSRSFGPVDDWNFLSRPLH